MVVVAGEHREEVERGEKLVRFPKMLYCCAVVKKRSKTPEGSVCLSQHGCARWLSFRSTNKRCCHSATYNGGGGIIALSRCATIRQKTRTKTKKTSCLVRRRLLARAAWDCTSLLPRPSPSRTITPRRAVPYRTVYEARVRPRTPVSLQIYSRRIWYMYRLVVHPFTSGGKSNTHTYVFGQILETPSGLQTVRRSSSIFCARAQRTQRRPANNGTS